MIVKCILNTILSLIGVVGGLFSTVQFVTAICFGELGRVLLYFVIAVLCIELAVISIRNLFRSKGKT